MKKFLALLLAALLVFTLAACQGGTPAAPEAPPAPEATPTPEAPEPDPEPEPEEGFAASDIHIALVAHSPDSILDDGSFNEGAWQGIQRFLSTHGLSADHARFFQPHSADDVARVDLVADAIAAGANIVVLPGFHFIGASAEMQEMFPDVKFVLLDATPAGGPAANTAAIHYAEEQAGFLAGYAAVMEGYRSLGFMGGIAVPAVVRFGHGFLQGAEHAAESLELEAGEVTVLYYYVGGFAPSPEVATTASAWFVDGVEVIFAAAGGAGGSVMSGAEASGGSVIGVDVDQSGDSDVVITSAMKALDVSVYDMLTDFLEGTFRGGRELMFDASVNGIGLPMNTSRFQEFTQAQYDAIFALLTNGSIVVSNVVTETVSEANLPLSLVEVTELN
ncbi:MAG: BMP family ABC transporter substrate-binding protein [Oscillospiraceae bacterium]|nr:BMP family ABC transporter substrate-binding protein [Oscillospiraceae bacterium]